MVPHTLRESNRHYKLMPHPEHPLLLPGFSDKQNKRFIYKDTNGFHSFYWFQVSCLEANGNYCNVYLIDKTTGVAIPRMLTLQLKFFRGLTDIEFVDAGRSILFNFNYVKSIVGNEVTLTFNPHPRIIIEPKSRPAFEL